MEHVIPRINKLTKTVAGKIAAGEVVDRPLSIVKELLENAIDAGAKSIAVEIKNGGKSYIRVTDDGCGIPQEDLLLAFERHATSKIREAEDLDAIQTLGFRGEALASIAAVSRIEVITKTRDEKLGSRLVLEGGEVGEQGPSGCPDGTTIVVTDLFYNTPARLKFMKQDSAESTLIIEFVSKMALAYPHLRIRLINNGTILFSTPGRGDVRTNIFIIYSREVGDRLIHVEGEDGDLHLLAYVSPPSQSKTTRKSQIFFVNGRNISSRLLEGAVSDAYREKLPDGRHPIAFLFLKAAPDKMDVNIHPNKREVRFQEEQRVRGFVADTLRRGLYTGDALPEIHSGNLFKYKKNEDSTPDQRDLITSTKDDQVDIKSLLSNLREERRESLREGNSESAVREECVSYQDAPGGEKGTVSQVLERAFAGDGKDAGSMALQTLHPANASKGPAGLSDGPAAPDGPANVQRSPAFRPEEIKITGVIFGTYLTGVDDGYFYLIDQHAAHERIFYEKLLAEYDREEKQSQLILTPFVEEVTHSLAQRSEEWLPVIRRMGFGIEEFGPKSFIAKEIPMFMSLSEARDFLDYFLENMEEPGTLRDPKQVEHLITRSCKSAVKAGDSLSPEEAIQLMKDLSCMENPFSCPHGRPTFVRLSRGEIEKLFKRA